MQQVWGRMSAIERMIEARDGREAGFGDVVESELATRAELNAASLRRLLTSR